MDGADPMGGAPPYIHERRDFYVKGCLIRMYERELIVLPSDASCRGQIKLRSFMNYLQDTASVAVADLEGTSSELMARGYAWILTRYEVEIIGQLPSLDEHFIVRTFHDPNHGYGTLRVFEVNGVDGAPLAWAKTSWLLLDLAAGRPVRPAVHIPEITMRDTAPIDPDFQNLPDFPAGAEVQEVPWAVRFHDLDSNGHVNNAAYFEWVFEVTPVDLMSYNLREVAASFRASARWGESLRIRTAEAPSASGGVRTFVHHILNDTRPSGNDRNPKPMTAFSCSWEPCRS